ncbi:capu [Trypoxylus dichotomus]
MGNIQAGDAKPSKPGKGKGLKIIRGKRGKSEEPQFVGVVPAEHFNQIVSEQDNEEDALIKPQENGTLAPKAQEKLSPQSGESSSDSVFTDPLTPVGFSAEINQCYYSEESVLSDVEIPDNVHDSFSHNFALNSFKLNEHKFKREKNLTEKLSKLGISKTSQISLEVEPNESFSSENVEVVTKNFSEVDQNISGESGICIDGGDILKSVDSEMSPKDDSETINKKNSDALLDYSSPTGAYKRIMSEPGDGYKLIEDSLVLKRVASLSLNVNEKLSLEVTKPKFVPEKLDFKLYEKFEGHMLLNWYLSELNEKQFAGARMNGAQDLKIIAAQFCTHLLAAGVLRQIPDKDTPMYTTFKPDLMYYWAHSEVPQSIPETPGKLSYISWPPTSPSSSEVYTPSSNVDSAGLKSPEPLKSEEVRPESKLSAKEAEILSLEEEVKRLKQEVEKYKTLIEIQNLTAQTVKDFSSPVEEEKRITCKNCDSSLNKCAYVVDNNNSEIRNFNDKNEIAKDNSNTLATHIIAEGKATQTSSSDNLEPSKTPFLGNEKKISDGEDVFGKVEDELDASIQSSAFIGTSSPIIANKKPSSATSITPPSSPILKSESNEPDASVPSVPPSPLPIVSIAPSIPPPPPLPLPLVDTYPPPPPPMPFTGTPAPPPLPMNADVAPPPPPPPLTGLGPPPLLVPGGGPPPPPMPGLSAPLPPPPPPMGGPAPLPPPPIGGWDAQKSMPQPPPTFQVLRKNPVMPSIPMKPLYWTRILVSANATTESGDASPSSVPLWAQLDEIPLDNISEFADLFSRQVIAKKPSSKKVEIKSKIEPKKLLDSKRSKSVGILAQSLHVDFHEIETAIYDLDTSVVSLEALQHIYEARATAEELKNIRAHTDENPDIPLDKPEQFLYDLSKISNFAERIFCFMFQAEFDDSITTVEHTLANMKSTCEFLTSNPALKEVFAIILTLGNYMNGGNLARGQADGFGLEILSKLKDVKSKDSQITLLHFIVQSALKKMDFVTAPIALPVPEHGDIERASSVNFDDIRMCLNKLQSQIDECNSRAQKVISASTPENLEPFQEKITTFLECARRRLLTETDNLKECKEIFISTMKYYHFRAKQGSLNDVTPVEFFDLWFQFCKDFKDIWKKECAKIEKEKIKELKRKENQRLSEKVPMKKRESAPKAKVEQLRRIGIRVNIYILHEELLYVMLA